MLRFYKKCFATIRRSGGVSAEGDRLKNLATVVSGSYVGCRCHLFFMPKAKITSLPYIPRATVRAMHDGGNRIFR